MPSRDEKNAHAPRHGSPAASHARPATRRARPHAPALARESDRISTIRAGQGARVTTRANAAEAAGRARVSAERRYAERHPDARAPKAGPRRSALNVVLLVVAAFLALAVVFVLGTLVTSLVFPPAEEQATQEQTLRLTESELEMQRQQEEHDAGDEQVGVDGTVSYGDLSFALSQGEGGAWSLVYASGDAVFELPGTPVALIRTGDTLLVPENVDGGWNVACYVIGGHSSGITYVVDEQGDPAGGSGDIESIELDGTTLRVTAGGTTTDVALA